MHPPSAEWGNSIILMEEHSFWYSQRRIVAANPAEERWDSSSDGISRRLSQKHLGTSSPALAAFRGGAALFGVAIRVRVAAAR